MSGEWRDVAALLRGSRASTYPGERLMLWAVVILCLAAIGAIPYLSVGNLIAGWPS